MGGALLGLFAGLSVLRVPIGVCLMAASMLSLIIFTNTPLTIASQRIVAGIMPFPLLAIPLFVLTGAVMNMGGVTRRLLDLAGALVGRATGSLAQTNVLASLLFGGLSGSAVADVSSLGRILIPEMKAKNYRAAYAAAVTAASAVISPILPPSITLIVYGVASGTSIGDLFIAGIGPALLYTAFLMIAVRMTVKKRGYATPLLSRKGPGAAVASNVAAQPRNDSPNGRLWPAFYQAIPALGLPVLILVGIRMGYFTPTEAAAVALFYALFCGIVVYREFRLPAFYQSLVSSARLVGLIMLVIAAAQLYSYALTSKRIPQGIAQSVFEITSNPVVLLLILNLLLLIVGMFIEANAAIIIMTPILLPLGAELGIDPVHLGIMVTINLGVGLITPPVGLCVMLAGEIAGVSYMQAIKDTVPFLVAAVVLILSVTFIPEISLWLPNLTQ